MELNDRIKAHATQVQLPVFTFANGREWDKEPAETSEPKIMHGDCVLPMPAGLL